MSTSGSALAQLKQFTLGSRSLFVKCTPAPRSFYERRAVLAALQKLSQQSIQMFKRLQDSSSFVVLTTRPEAATKLIDRSPLKRIVVTQGYDSEEALRGFHEDVSGPIAPPVNPVSSIAAIQPTPASTNLGISHTRFVLHIFPANPSYNHREEARKNPFHGKWPDSAKTDTFVSAALRRVVPSSAMAPALRDWETGNPLASDSDSFADDGPEGASSMILGRRRRTSGAAFALERIRRREGKQETPKVMNSLVKFAEECGVKPVNVQPESSQSTIPWPQDYEGTSDIMNPKELEALIRNSEPLEH
ncbi:hypothetical protein F5Y09DRAFT_202471 [Xylaria sp. FL1042]|nr:hypothetical protein F5Y09DRAFT_202471 [Xylaria sp. FL1042]